MFFRWKKINNMTSISELGGEFALIGRVVKTSKRREVVIGAGKDDAAVIDFGTEKLLLFTTDMLVEKDHFSRDWYTPEQIGSKAMEVNISDIAAMGGLPKYATISIALTRNTTVEFVEKLYEGIYGVCKKHKIEVIGGDTTHSKLMVISVTLVGEVEHEYLCLRSGAKEGDLIVVTGDLGKSKAGLEVLMRMEKSEIDNLDLSGHLEPKSRLNEARVIAPFAHAMIDVSDGLASEVRHICKQSKVGAIVKAELIPISKNTLKLAELVGGDAIDYALHGGEDYELVFTISREGLRNLRNLKIDCPLSIVGEIIAEKEGLWLEKEGKRIPLGRGFDHFA